MKRKRSHGKRVVSKRKRIKLRREITRVLRASTETKRHLANSTGTIVPDSDFTTLHLSMPSRGDAGTNRDGDLINLIRLKFNFEVLANSSANRPVYVRWWLMYSSGNVSNSDFQNGTAFPMYQNETLGRINFIDWREVSPKMFPVRKGEFYISPESEGTSAGTIEPFTKGTIRKIVKRNVAYKGKGLPVTFFQGSTGGLAGDISKGQFNLVFWADVAAVDSATQSPAVNVSTEIFFKE